MAKTLAVIPARYASTRFPGKVLAELGGKPIIQHVWERAVKSKADEVLVAVDEQKVFDAVCAFGPGDLPNPRIEPRSPALQADSLPTELSGSSPFQTPISGFLQSWDRRVRPRILWRNET